MKIQVKQTTNLLAFALECFPQVSVSKAKKMILYNCFSLNGASIKSFEFILHKGDIIDYQRYSGGRHIAKERRDVAILYEDEDVLVVNKSFGTPIFNKGNNKERSLSTMIRSYLKRKYRDDFELHLVFSPLIDESGLCLFAKNQFALKKLKDNYENMIFNIDAIVTNPIKHKNDKIKFYVTKQKDRLNVVDSSIEGAKELILQYKTIETIEKDGETFYHLSVTQTTNISYQTRFLLKQINNPVLGDYRFDRTQKNKNILKLFYSSMTFFKPKTGKKIQIDCLLPNNFNVFNSPVHNLNAQKEENI
jgi:23S rRNA-/tRNA-specific pseudouridylate synthase